MRLSDHLSKATWSFADKALYAGYGLVSILQIHALLKVELGVYAFFGTTFTILFTLSDGFILQSVVKYGVDEERRGEVLTITLLAHSVYLLFASLVIVAIRTPLSELFNEPRYVDVLTAMPILCLLTIPRTYGLKFFQMLIRTREIFFIDLAWFGTMTLATLYRIYTHTFTTANDFIAVNLAGAIGGSVIAIILAMPHARFSLRFSKVNLRGMASFGLYQGLAVMTNVLQQNADIYIIKYFSNELQVANYQTAKNFFRAFESVRDAVGTVIYPAVARLHVQERFEELRVLVEKAQSFVFVAMIPVVLACELGGTALLFHMVFGSKYDDAIPVFNILAIYGLIIPFTQNLVVLTGLGESKAILRIVIIASSVSIASNFLLVPRLQAIGAAETLIIASIVTGLLATIAVKQSIPFHWISILRGLGDGLRFFAKRLEHVRNHSTNR